MGNATITPDAPVQRPLEQPRARPAITAEAKLYGLRGAPPSFSAELMLRHKRVPYRRVNLIPGRHPRTLPTKGFPGRTCPAIELNGRPVQTNGAIARALDELVPDPPLFPADPVERALVEEVERFCDRIFQHACRRMTLWSLTADPDSVVPHPAIGRLLVPRNRLLAKLLMPRIFSYYGITEAVVHADFEALPEMLDLLDGAVDAGVLEGPVLTAADFQVAPLIAVLRGHRSLFEEIVRRPVGALVERVLPR